MIAATWTPTGIVADEHRKIMVPEQVGQRTRRFHGSGQHQGASPAFGQLVRRYRAAKDQQVHVVAGRLAEHVTGHLDGQLVT